MKHIDVTTCLKAGLWAESLLRLNELLFGSLDILKSPSLLSADKINEALEVRLGNRPPWVILEYDRFRDKPSVLFKKICNINFESSPIVEVITEYSTRANESGPYLVPGACLYDWLDCYSLLVTPCDWPYSWDFICWSELGIFVLSHEGAYINVLSK